jgi:hypothetical protein
MTYLIAEFFTQVNNGMKLEGKVVFWHWFPRQSTSLSRFVSLGSGRHCRLALTSDATRVALCDRSWLIKSLWFRI